MRKNNPTLLELACLAVYVVLCGLAVFAVFGLQGCGPTYKKLNRERKTASDFEVYVYSGAPYTRSYVVRMDGKLRSQPTPVRGMAVFLVNKYLPHVVEVERVGGPTWKFRLGVDYQVGTGSVQLFDP